MNTRKQETREGSGESAQASRAQSRVHASRSGRFIVRQPDPRVIAAMVVERVLANEGSAGAALPSVLRRFRNVDDRCRSTTSELVYTTLRMRPKVEAHLAELAARGVRNDTAILSHLLVAATELMFLDRDPEQATAAVDVAVSQIEVLRGPRMAGIANGILSKLLAYRTAPDGANKTEL